MLDIREDGEIAAYIVKGVSMERLFCACFSLALEMTNAVTPREGMPDRRSLAIGNCHSEEPQAT